MDEAADISPPGIPPASSRAPEPRAELSVTPRDSLLAGSGPIRGPDRTAVPDNRAGGRSARLRMIINRHIRSGLMGGKRFEVGARVEGVQDLAALFKGFPDELVLAYKSVFSDKSHSLKRSELLKGCRLTVGSLNEIIELEERLAGAFDQIRRMVEILEGGEGDVVTEG